MSTTNSLVSGVLNNANTFRKLNRDGGAVRRIAKARESNQQLAALMSTTSLANYAMFEKGHDEDTGPGL